MTNFFLRKLVSMATINSDVSDNNDFISESKMPQGPATNPFIKPFVVLALPGMYLFYKYNQYRRRRKETAKRRLTERELQHLNSKIVSRQEFVKYKKVPCIYQFSICEIKTGSVVRILCKAQSDFREVCLLRFLQIFYKKL